MKAKEIKKEVVIYQAKSGAIELRGDFGKETVWATRMQMAEMFEVNPQAISKHIQNIYKGKELARGATSSKMELVQNESGREVRRGVSNKFGSWYKIPPMGNQNPPCSYR